MIDSDYRLSIPSILYPAELYGVVDRMLSAADSVIPADAASFERKQFVMLGELNAVLGMALGERQTEDPQKEAKQQADVKRDSGFLRIKNTVNIVLEDDGEEDQVLKEAAAMVKQALADYPANLHSTKHSDNTVLLNSLIPKLREKAVATAIATLGLTRYVDRMQEGNEQFKQASRASVEVRAQDVPRDWVAAKPVRWHGSQFAGNLAFLGEIDDAFAPLAALVRQFINDAEAIARARKTRRKNKNGGNQEPIQAPA